MTVEDEEGNAEEAVDHVLEADTLIMCGVRCRGIFIRRSVLILLLVLVLVSVMLIVMMMMMAIRRRLISGSTQECSHGQLAVKLDIRSGSHIHGQREITKGIGKVESMMLSMLMRSHRHCRSTLSRRPPNGLLLPSVLAVDSLGAKEESRERNSSARLGAGALNAEGGGEKKDIVE